MAIFHNKFALQVIKRITLNKITFAFFVFAFFHCFAQGILHAFLFSIDSEYDVLLKGISEAVRMPNGNHTYLDGGAGFWSKKGSGRLDLFMCQDIPKINCTRIHSSSQDLQPLTNDSIRIGRAVVENLHEGLRAVPTQFPLPNVPAVTLKTKSGEDVITLSQSCAQVLVYPQQHMHTALREDVTLVLMQFWLFGMSFFAMLYDSAPHVLATFIARTLLTGWSGYALARTQHQKFVYNHLVEQPSSPCNLRLFDQYFSTRMGYEVPDLFLSVTAWGIAAYLSWAILKLYATQSINRLGAPKHVTRIHRIFLSLMAALHLELFVILTAVGLWVDQLFNSYLRSLSGHTDAYQAGSIVVCVLIFPWIATGYYAISRERHKLMLVFLVISFIYLAGWSGMFYSQIYRWTFVMWPFMACHTLAALLLIIVSTTLGIVCRMNFGKGHAQYLYADSALSALNFKSEIFQHDVEKQGRESFILPKPTGFPVFSPGVAVNPDGQPHLSGAHSSSFPAPTFY